VRLLGLNFGSTSLGPVFWLMISEIYPLRIRGTAMSVASIANWGSNFLVALTFPVLLAALGGQGRSGCSRYWGSWRGFSSTCGCPRPRGARWRR
jgi:hypothetical protein